jgi:predicted metalloprotease with PDZ domain
MFYSLYSEMGQASFDDAIGDFYQSHKDRGWTFDGLVSHLQARWPADLTGFFREWIYTTGWYDQLQTGISPAAIGFER